ncbi:ImmA/IrrE family metallo-endopeptidase [Homoserinibacter sp. GY 40078]|uniref:ImmA/IrrE family metallo-endopeptidase n=1 Tax=Homoserinibacter sp. GY 40078 TaxID=2603275 RepID=UPI0011C71A50|nr:ImmA/IrrE family metallo-endopeptidase [Homoserinibacter sp. GY 40078]TXK17186.1 ImmA/IrrE family metallo-endopeptidase [Homoserinibacter sp. GY 40078]
MLELLRLASERGVTVHACHLPGDMLGCYEPGAERIWFDLRLTPHERRSVIAHELGHHHYGHRESTPRNERLANRYAARLLIDPEEYAQAERLYSEAEAIADELRVTVKIIESYRTLCLGPESMLRSA